MSKQTIRPNDFLVVIDVQNDFCPGGTFAIPEADRIVPVLNQLGARFAHVVLAQDWHPENHISFASNHPGAQPWDRVSTPYGEQFVFVDHCVQNTHGAEFHPGLQLSHAEAVIRKGFDSQLDSNSAFIGNDEKTPTGLHGYLRARGCGRVFLAGLALDGCVWKSAEHAKDLGYEVFVVTDASQAIDIEGSKCRALDSMTGKGVHLIDSDAIA